MYVRACSRGVHAAAIYGAETLAVSPPYGGSNAPATIFISVTATPWKWEPAEWEPPSPRLVMPRASSTRTYVLSEQFSFVAWLRRFSLSLSLYVPFIHSFVASFFLLDIFPVLSASSTYFRHSLKECTHSRECAFMCICRSDDRHWCINMYREICIFIYNIGWLY